MRAIGEETVRLLLGILQHEVLEPVSVTLPHETVVRASTAPPRSRCAQAAAIGNG